MNIRWYGQSAFSLRGERTVFIDPLGRVERLTRQGLKFDYPPIEGVEADLLLITHEHGDHNAVEAVGDNGHVELLESLQECQFGLRPLRDFRHPVISLDRSRATLASAGAGGKPSGRGMADTAFPS